MAEILAFLRTEAWHNILNGFAVEQKLYDQYWVNTLCASNYNLKARILIWIAQK